MYVGFKTSFYVVRHLDSIASYLPTGLHLGLFRLLTSLYLPSSFSSVFLVLSFVSASTSMLFWVIFPLPFFECGWQSLNCPQEARYLFAVLTNDIPSGSLYKLVYNISTVCWTCRRFGNNILVVLYIVHSLFQGQFSTHCDILLPTEKKNLLFSPFLKVIQ